MLRFYDFFAGAGLATCGLSHAWQCVWANDIDVKKSRVYKANFGAEHFHPGDVANFRAADLPNATQLAWASFPCQDLSLAGWRRGLSANRSGAFWPFWRILRGRLDRGGRPPVVVIENVVGLLYGESFAGLCEALAALGMNYGALVIDARSFVPQSRPRVFVVAVDARVDCSGLDCAEPERAWTPRTLARAHEDLSSDLRARWKWWNLPVPADPVASLAGIIEKIPTGVEWHSDEETRYLLSLMNGTNHEKVRRAMREGGRHIGFVYRRIRDGVQRAEIRFDGIAGCLRTPKGGSSRQTVLLIEDGKVRSRLLSVREAARLMGAPDSFKLPKRYNDGYKAMGDGVAVPVVRWLSAHLLEPLAKRATGMSAASVHGAAEDFLERAERRASAWVVEANKIAARELIEMALAEVEEWHKAWSVRKSTESDSFIACAGIKVAEASRKRWPVLRRDLVSEGGRFRSTRLFIQRVLERRFSEERPYASGRGRVEATCIPASEDLVARLDDMPGYAEASSEERGAVADAIEKHLYDTIVKKSLDAEGISAQLNF